MNDTTRRRLGRGCEAVLLFGLYAVPLTVSWTVAGVHIALGIAAAGGLAGRAVTGRWPLSRTPAHGGMLAFTVASVLATLGSVDFGLSVVGLKKLLLLPAIPLAAFALATPHRARTALRLLVAGMAVTACVAAARFELLPHATDARLRSTGHYMTFAGLLLLAWPLAAACAVALRGRKRWAYGTATLILGAALLLTFTRSAWIGVVLATAAMLVRARPRLAWLVLPAIGLGLAVMPVSYRERALSSFDPTHPFNADRLRLWRAGVAIYRDHPWTGVGLVDLKPLYMQYRDTTAGRVHGHLHDNWVQVAATLGTLGLVAFAWLMVGFGRIAWNARGGGPPGTELTALGNGTWGAFWGFQAMGLFEWNFGDVEVTIALFFLLGAAAAADRAVPRQGQSRRTPARGTDGGPGGSLPLEVQG